MIQTDGLGWVGLTSGRAEIEPKIYQSGMTLNLSGSSQITLKNKKIGGVGRAIIGWVEIRPGQNWHNFLKTIN